MNHNSYPAFGVDAKIKIQQDAIYKALGWSGVKFFGRVSKVYMADGKQREALVYEAANEGIEVYLDDKAAASGSVFFIDDDEHQPKGYGVMEAKVKMVFMLNLEKLFGKQGARLDAQVQETAFKLASNIKVMGDIGIQKSVDKVLKDVKNDHLRQYDKQPLHIFAITGTIRYHNSTCKN